MISRIIQVIKDAFSGKPEATRSPSWPKARERWLAVHPTCEVCGALANVEVHHIVPVHIDKSGELNESNFITLCRDDHYAFGHLRNWNSYNIDVVQDAALWKQKIKTRP